MLASPEYAIPGLPIVVSVRVHNRGSFGDYARPLRLPGLGGWPRLAHVRRRRRHDPAHRHHRAGPSTASSPVPLHISTRSHRRRRQFIKLAASSGMRNVTVWHLSVRPSVCPVDILTVAHSEAARDAASVHFGPTVRMTEYLFLLSRPTLGHWQPTAGVKVATRLPSL